MVPEINIDITNLLEKYLTPLVIGFTIGLVLYLTVFNCEWGWPTVIGCVSFLFIQVCVWMKENYDWNKSAEIERQAQVVQNEMFQSRILAKEKEREKLQKFSSKVVWKSPLYHQ